MAREWPKIAQKWPKIAQNGPNMTQNGPNMTQNGPKISTVHKILNLKGIFAVLSQIWKCRKSRFFGANFFGRKMVGANFFAFCNYDSRTR